MKPFRFPGLWLGLWCLAIAVVVILSVMPPPPLPELPSGTDKLEHFAAYFLLASGAVQLFPARRQLLWCGGLLVLLGIALEWVQGTYTQTRLQDPWDALANSLGVAAGLMTCLSPRRDGLLRWEKRRMASG